MNAKLTPDEAWQKIQELAAPGLQKLQQEGAPVERMMDELEPLRRFYMKHYYDPEASWRRKNPEPFRFH